MATPGHNVGIKGTTDLKRASVAHMSQDLPLHCRHIDLVAQKLQEMNPRFADIGKRKTMNPVNIGFILHAVAQWPRFHAICFKNAFSRRFRQELGR